MPEALRPGSIQAIVGPLGGVRERPRVHLGLRLKNGLGFRIAAWGSGKEILPHLTLSPYCGETKQCKFLSTRHPPRAIADDQMEKKMEHEMEAGFIQGFMELGFQIIRGPVFWKPLKQGLRYLGSI